MTGINIRFAPDTLCHEVDVRTFAYIIGDFQFEVPRLSDRKWLVTEKHKAALGNIHQIAEELLGGFIVNPSIVKKMTAFGFASFFHLVCSIYVKYKPDDCVAQSRG